MDYSNLFVCLMGIGTVFVGLVCIILLVTLMSYVCRKSDAKSVAPAPLWAWAATCSAMIPSIGTLWKICWAEPPLPRIWAPTFQPSVLFL